MDMRTGETVGAAMSAIEDQPRSSGIEFLIFKKLIAHPYNYWQAVCIDLVHCFIFMTFMD
ncbi:MAG: hypothetical protein RBR01_04775 [Desulfobacterales bacterium]|jgi:hypothetical protein|nr:hypothetical protein [Desulfobacterales bacterium]MDD3949621.1 hypothetical protein [Desulfobacterales bacterium]MDD4463062.1 hypothetical protein [Desulfobacterales bacterium]MDY0377730.1 hypothetical protein [Desulfobacterales bacterium]